MHRLDVTIVGGGPAGIGMAVALSRLPDLRYAVLEGDRVGESFRRWPEQTHLITPSFHSNPFGLADLNAVCENSSPARHAGAEHPSGQQYADYLTFVARAHSLPVVTGCRVRNVSAVPGGGFILSTESGELFTRFLIWATGEYQFPDLSPFPGGQLCAHYARVTSWADFDAPHYTVIGGFESGADAAANLVRNGCKVRLLARKSSWDPEYSHDPSLVLSPHTRGRLYAAMDTGRLEIVFGVDVAKVAQTPGGGYRIHAADGREWDEARPPILGTGFLEGGGARQIADLWDRDDAGRITLTENDESTRTPGLFLAGPQVRHDERIYCFIYKFRQRFALVAGHIADRMAVDANGLRVGNGAWGPFGNLECCAGCAC